MVLSLVWRKSSAFFEKPPHLCTGPSAKSCSYPTNQTRHTQQGDARQSTEYLTDLGTEEAFIAQVGQQGQASPKQQAGHKTYGKGNTRPWPPQKTNQGGDGA